MNESPRRDEVAMLRGRVRGPVLLRGDDGYDAERAGFQADEPHAPAVIVGAAAPEDVQAAVAFGAARSEPVAVQASGHGLAARATEGVLVTTGRLRGLRLDPATRTAWIQAGVPWAQVIEAAAAHGLAPINGSAPGVGAVGYTLAGGLGLLGRRFGWAADHVRSLDVVTADGRLRHTTAEENPDLFWGLRGGGGNLGIVTAMEAELVPLRQVWGGALFFDGEHAPAVLEAYRTWTEPLPDELTSSVALLAYPDLPALPAALRGRYVASVRLAFTGDPEAGDRLLAPIRQVAPTLLDTVRVLPWTESHTITTDPPQPHPYLGTNAVLRDLDPVAAQTILELAGPDAPLPCVVQVNHLGGALGRRPAVPNAVGRRDGRYLLRVLSVVGASGRRPIAGAHERLLTALQRVTVGRLVGFQFGEHSIEQTRACYDTADYRRLAELKATYDPENRFRCNHNVPPA